jgi:hypothetical protein
MPPHSFRNGITPNSRALHGNFCLTHEAFTTAHSGSLPDRVIQTSGEGAFGHHAPECDAFTHRTPTHCLIA